MRHIRLANTKIAATTGALGAAAALLGAGASGAGPGSTHAAPTDPSQDSVAAVKMAFSRAMHDRERVYVAARALPASRKAHPLAALSAREQSAVVSSGQNTLRRDFTGPALVKEFVALESGVSEQAQPGLVVQSAGVESISFGKVSVSGNTASVNATVTVWSELAHPGPGTNNLGHAKPTNVLNERAALVRDAAGIWRVSDWTATFAPGNGP